MSNRVFGQFCGLARALEVVGERWALLIVRDLLVGPRRFSDLKRGLPKIPTNILSARLKELEQAGLVARRVLPRPASSVVYELSALGSGLEASVLALGRWGAQLLGEPRDGEVVTTDSLIMALRTTFHPPGRGVRLGFELRFGEHVLHARVDGVKLVVAEGPLERPDLVIEAGPGLKPLLAREVAPAAALADGSVRVIGDPALLSRFVEIFYIDGPAALTGS
jgi:DNA-binding HxlR family transcriptional regulator